MIDPEKETIDSQEKLRAYVYRWSSNHGKDPIPMQKFAEQIFDNVATTPVTGEFVGISLKHFSGRASDVAQSFDQSFALAIGELTKWSIELCKLLALLATTGLAGSVAIRSLSTKQLSNISAYPTILFAAALLFILACFWCTTNSYVTLSADLNRKRKSIRHIASWEEYGTALEFELSRKNKIWSRLGATFGWLSAMSSLTGLILLGYLSIWPLT